MRKGKSKKDSKASTSGRSKRADAPYKDAIKPNPPRTQTGKIASPKFGSAGSGGAEIEPGPERD
jgi:hypothetical protein